MGWREALYQLSNLPFLSIDLSKVTETVRVRGGGNLL